MWKMRFKIDMMDKPLTIFAEDVRFPSMPFIKVTGLRKEMRSPIISLPDDDSFKEVSDLDSLYIPYHSVVYIGTVDKKGEVKEFSPKAI